MKLPGECANMRELRQEIDRIDEVLIGLLAERSAYIERAIELKPAEGIPANVPERVAAVLERTKRLAAEKGLAPELAERIWSEMMYFFIGREEEVLGR